MTLRVGIVGAGAVAGAIHLPSFAASTGAKVVAVASRSIPRAAKLAAKFGIRDVMRDASDLMQRHDIDAVVICTPPSVHRELVELALRHDKCVLLEKPIATTLEDLDAIRAAAEGSPRTVDVVRNERFMEFNVEAKRLLATGMVGATIGVMQSITTLGPDAWSATASWFRDPLVSGGGALIDLAVHKIDVAAWLTGKAVESVGIPSIGRQIGGVEETGAVNVLLEGGVIASVFASWLGPPDESTLTVVGTGGLIDGVSSQGRLRVVGGGTEKEMETVVPWSEHDRSGEAMVAAFVEACRAGRRPIESDDAWDSGTRSVLASYARAKGIAS